MPLQATSGAASYDAFGGGVAAVPNYIEDVFSTYLYTGNGSTQTITNGIDLSGKGGLVWCKARTTGGLYHTLTDTATGASKALFSNDTSSQLSGNYVTAFGATGFSIGNNGYLNYNNEPTVSWTFRKQPKFFDVVTYTGNGSLPNQLISHNLGSVPGCIIIKATNAARNWIVWHRGNGTTNYTGFSLNLTAASAASVASGDLPTATQFKPGAFFDPDYNGANETGITYVAYLFAHNAGGFGLTGTDNVISCGTFTTTATAQEINLGYEPQWLLWKFTNTGSAWYLTDNMRGFVADRSGGTVVLNPNSSAAEQAWGEVGPTATGFTHTNGTAGNTIIYIAIRRGPMKVPTDGTSVFSPLARTGTGSTYSVTSLPFPPDLIHSQSRDAYGANAFYDRLRGGSKILFPNATSAEGTDASISSFNQNGFSGSGVADYANFTGVPYVFHAFRRAPGFFDEVCYTGSSNDDATQTLPHNLTVVPELMIVKRRSGAAASWQVYSAALPASQFLVLNGTGGAAVDSSVWNATVPNASTFTIGTKGSVNLLGATYVNYLFATCPGVSKVGSYTGTGTTQTINCGFTAGSRFVMIKRTDSTGDWYVWDSARGIVAGNDPYLLLNSTAAEVTNTDYIDTASTGFEISSTAPAAINASGGSFIFLAIA